MAVCLVTAFYGDRLWDSMADSLHRYHSRRPLCIPVPVGITRYHPRCRDTGSSSAIFHSAFDDKSVVRSVLLTFADFMFAVSKLGRGRSRPGDQVW